VNLRLLADENLDRRIVHGLRRRIPAIDFLFAHGAIPESTPDPEVLLLAMKLGRVLVSHDVDSMPGHFYRFLATHESPGVILIKQTYPTGLAIRGLELICGGSAPEELENRIIYIR
jgi:hypothetical protein